MKMKHEDNFFLILEKCVFKNILEHFKLEKEGNKIKIKTTSKVNFPFLYFFFLIIPAFDHFFKGPNHAAFVHRNLDLI